MKYFIYILFSPAFKRTYVGQTENISERLRKHHSGLVKSTKSYKPWIHIYSEIFETRSEAMKREKWFKSASGRKKIAVILNSHLMNENIGLSVHLDNNKMNEISSRSRIGMD